MTLFMQFWKPLEDAKPECLYSELYTSDAMLKAHTKIQSLPPSPKKPYLERVVAALMA